MIELDDLISAGVVGLVSAVDNYNASHGASLKTYAEYKIRGAILDSIRGLDGIPAHKRKRLKWVQRAITKLETELKRAPSEDEIAAELDISLAEFQQWMVDLRGVSLGSLNVTEERHSNLYTECGRHSDDWLFGGIADAVKSVFKKNEK